MRYLGIGLISLLCFLRRGYGIAAVVLDRSYDLQM